MTNAASANSIYFFKTHLPLLLQRIAAVADSALIGLL